MENIRDVRAVCDPHRIPLFLDACRFAENAWFIRMREKGYADRDIGDIVREMASYADGMTMSAKKDPLANIGGWLARQNKNLPQKSTNLLLLTQRLFPHRGVARRHLPAVPPRESQAIPPALP